MGDALFVEVHWLDAVNHAGWVSSLAHCKPLMVVQRGWLVVSEEDHIVLSMSEPNADSDFLGVQVIPRDMIADYWVIEIK